MILYITLYLCFLYLSIFIIPDTSAIDEERHPPAKSLLIYDCGGWISVLKIDDGKEHLIYGAEVLVNIDTDDLRVGRYTGLAHVENLPGRKELWAPLGPVREGLYKNFVALEDVEACT